MPDQPRMEPERSILADREALERTRLAYAKAEHPLVKAALEADMRYLSGLIDRYEAQFFDLHGLNEGTL